MIDGRAKRRREIEMDYLQERIEKIDEIKDFLENEQNILEYKLKDKEKEDNEIQKNERGHIYGTIVKTTPNKSKETK